MRRPAAVALAAVVAAAIGLAAGSSARPGLAASLLLTSQALTPYRTCTITATPTTTTSVADASVRQGSAGTNFGAATTANVATGSGANRRLYIRFDLTACSPAIPTSAVVRQATLRLFVATLPTACRTIDVFSSTTAWTEAAITWTNQPLGTTPNTPVASGAVATFALGTPTACANHAAGAYVGASLTSAVAAIVAGTAANNGWMLRDDAEDSATAYSATFDAKEFGTVSAEPQLVVTWVAVP